MKKWHLGSDFEFNLHNFSNDKVDISIGVGINKSNSKVTTLVCICYIHLKFEINLYFWHDFLPFCYREITKATSFKGNLKFFSYKMIRFLL